MLKEKFKKISDWFNNLSPTSQGMIVLGIILIIGIIIRWDYILDEVMRGFGFFSGN
ncbi:MAG: hypothetical protein IJB58_04175 [Bacteroidales bacterium]|nr:hypothetical protein [Bacteroidales bacterium]